MSTERAKMKSKTAGQEGETPGSSGIIGESELTKPGAS